MKTWFLVVGLAVGQCAFASPFPWWFHTRPKPVLISYQPENKANENPGSRSPAPQATQPKAQPRTPEHLPSKPSFIQQLFAGRPK